MSSVGMIGWPTAIASPQPGPPAANKRSSGKDSMTRPVALFTITVSISFEGPKMPIRMVNADAIRNAAVGQYKSDTSGLAIRKEEADTTSRNGRPKQTLDSVRASDAKRGRTPSRERGGKKV